LVGLIGVALGASLIMVLLVALTAAGLTVIIARHEGSSRSTACRWRKKR
jgi:hypothetical protein